MKEKAYIFRRNFYVDGLDVSDKELRDLLVENCLSRGYFPFEPKLVSLPNSFARRATTLAAYAGKKAARTIGVQPWPKENKTYCLTNNPLSV